MNSEASVQFSSVHLTYTQKYMNLRSYKVIHLTQFLVRLRPSQSDIYPGYQYFLPLLLFCQHHADPTINYFF